MLLSEDGLDISAFDPVLAAVLGNANGETGGKVLAEALLHTRAEVQLRDWLYCLVRAPGTKLRKHLIDIPGKRPETFVNLIEDSAAPEAETGAPPLCALTSATVAPAVRTMLDAAERLAATLRRPRVTDSILARGLLDAADEELTHLLTAWASEDGMKRLRADLIETAPAELQVFDKNGDLVASLFDASGRSFCRRLVEDAASLSAKQVTSRHFLYTLLGNDDGLLSIALAVRGIDVKKELHSTLSRELARPGRKRVETFALRYLPSAGNRSAAETSSTAFPTVAQLLRAAGDGAARRGAARIGEYDISRAFVAQQVGELLRLFPSGGPLDLAALRDYMEAAEPEAEEEKPSARFSIRQIEENIKKRVCGQDGAIHRLLPWIKRLRFGLPRDGRPAAVFLFLGPTGTGKTQVAKELARYVFGDEDMIIFLEMGQFKTKEAMSGFIGAPPGYIGYGDGKLTNGLRDRPECVVLFDEIEKADSQVFDTLLRFADEGMISDPAGPVRDGRKCIIVMTSNAGQSWLRDNPQHRESPNLSQLLFDAAMTELRLGGLKPEFLARVDERISFLPLSRQTCREIVDGELERELEKFKRIKDVTLIVPDEVRDFLARKAYERSPDEGARGAPRAINEFIVTPAIDQLSEQDEGAGERRSAVLHASMVGLDRVVLEIASARPAAG